MKFIFRITNNVNFYDSLREMMMSEERQTFSSEIRFILHITRSFSDVNIGCLRSFHPVDLWRVIEIGGDSGAFSWTVDSNGTDSPRERDKD